ncbi:hypothetical protein WOLCODRAFT_68517, partial [Wolfiporia cocos MD-104 SS10]
KQIVCMSILVHSTNQQCNTVQSMIGLFLHSCRTSETVLEFLSRIGLSISRTSIDNAVTSLSHEAGVNMKQLGQSLPHLLMTILMLRSKN